MPPTASPVAMGAFDSASQGLGWLGSGEPEPGGKGPARPPWLCPLWGQDGRASTLAVFWTDW